MLYSEEHFKASVDALEASALIEKLREQLAQAEADKRSAERRQRAVANHPTAVAMAVSAPLRQEGIGSEHADALNFVLSLPIEQFMEEAEARVGSKPTASVAHLVAEIVKSGQEELGLKGRDLALEREWRAYEWQCENFAAWQKANPEKTSWRSKPASRAQYFLMWRTAEALGIRAIGNCKSGDAHDWLVKHGANLRLKAVGEALGKIKGTLNG